MRVPKIFTSRTSWKGPRRALLDINKDAETGEWQLNSLCGACRGLQFDFKAARETGLEETSPVKLYDGMGDMFESALGGCHLCTIFLEALGVALYDLRIETDCDSRSIEGCTYTADEGVEESEDRGDEEDTGDSEHEEGNRNDDDGEHAENSSDDGYDDDNHLEDENSDHCEEGYDDEDDDSSDLTRRGMITTDILYAHYLLPSIQKKRSKSIVDRDTVLSNAKSLPLLTRWFPGPVLVSCKRDRESLRVFYENNDTSALSATVLLSYAADPLGKNHSFHDQRGMQLALSICQGTHRVCQKSKFFALPKRLIDISQGLGNIRLIETSISDSLPDEMLKQKLQYGYATVSHRWGPDLSCKLTSQTQDEYQRRIPQSDLPPHFRDAILLASALYLEFLWIDSLCIVQAGDGGKDWLEQAPEMANIYRGAELTISFDCTEAWRGFPRISPRQMRPCAIPSLKSKRAVGPLPTIQQAIDLGDLEARAWTMQERLLSRRVVHCTGWGMVWECAEENTGLEDNKHERSLFSNGRQHGLMLHAEPQAYKPIVWGDYSTYPSLRPVTQPFFNVWYKLVEKYSYRVLTVPSDRLIAVAGLARQFSSCSTVPITYLAGIWAEDFVHGLSWRATDSLSNLPDHLLTQASQMRKSLGMVSFGLLQYRAPSWSWASVDCSIDYASLYDCYKDPAPKLDYAPTLLSYNFDNSNDDPFGILASASITMKGLCADHLAFTEPACKVPVGGFCRSSDKPPELLGRSGTVELDRNGVEMSDDGVEMWSSEPLDMMPKDTVVLLLWKIPTVEGLVLLPAGENSRCYRRIGKWSLSKNDVLPEGHFNLDNWKERTLTIV